MCEEKTNWNGNHFVEAKQKMEIMEEYINQGIAADICFSQKFAETAKKYFARICSDGNSADKFLKKVKALEAILNN